MDYMIKRSTDYLAHAGKKGMKWGYTDGKRNGKRTAEDMVNDLADSIGFRAEYVEEVRQLGLKYGFDSKQYKDELKYLSEGDPEAADMITKSLKKTRSVKDIAKDKLGFDERNRMKAAGKEVDRVVSEKGTKAERRVAAYHFEEAHAEYMKTPMGKAKQATDKLKAGSRAVSNMLTKRKKK